MEAQQESTTASTDRLMRYYGPVAELTERFGNTLTRATFLNRRLVRVIWRELPKQVASLSKEVSAPRREGGARPERGSFPEARSAYLNLRQALRKLQSAVASSREPLVLLDEAKSRLYTGESPDELEEGIRMAQDADWSLNSVAKETRVLSRALLGMRESVGNALRLANEDYGERVDELEASEELEVQAIGSLLVGIGENRRAIKEVMRELRVATEYAKRFG